MERGEIMTLDETKTELSSARRGGTTSLHLSHSQISCFNNCKQEYYYKYIKGLKPKRFSTALNFGKYFHLGMELLYKHGNADIAISGVMSQLDLLTTWAWEEKDFQDFAWMKIVLRGMIDGYYDIFYLDDMEKGYEIVELEKRYDMPIINPKTNRPSRKYSFVFIADGVLKDKNDDLWLVEYKTASQIGDLYLDRLLFDNQVTGMLAYLGKVYKKPFKGVLYRIMRKPGIRQKKTETEIQFLERLSDVFHTDSERYFIEAILTRTPEELKDFEKSLWTTQKDIQNTVKCKGYYRNTNNCVLKSCAYMPLCAKKEDAGQLYERREDLSKLSKN